ncbi:MAG: hypothetical protein QF718_01060 [Phycisphaerales bacterium]|nr:hypothetical protein [Phycisphaerales bacterium]
MSILTCLVIVVGCSWVLGNILSDRWVWSQWFSWIPTLGVLFLFLVVNLLVIISKSKKRAVLLSTCSVALLIWFSFVENKFFINIEPDQDKGISIAAWTMSHPKKKVSSMSANKIVLLDADITLLTHGWHVRGEETIKDWLEPKGRKLISGPFTLLTKFQAIEIRSLIASDGIYISMFVLDTTEKLGKPLILWAIDLPSSLLIPRVEIANRTKRLLKKINAPKPDVVMGDFNMTLNSYSIKALFPNHKDASDDGGTGWIASYPSWFPVYHIDHTLIADWLNARSYELINPNIGRHRIQSTKITTK